MSGQGNERGGADGSGGTTAGGEAGHAGAADLESAIRALIPPFPEGSEADSLQEWRIRIDLIDRLVLALLNERAVCANRIGRLKKQQGMPVYVPSREDEVLRNVMESNRGPLPDASVKHLFERIIDEIRALERRYVQGEQGEG